MAEPLLTPEAVLWAAIGFMFARAFAKPFDREVQATPWYAGLGRWSQWAVRGLLDFLHHWWCGLLIYTYCPWPPAQYFGLGMAIDDAPDIPRRFRRYFSYLAPESGLSGDDASSSPPSAQPAGGR